MLPRNTSLTSIFNDTLETRILPWLRWRCKTSCLGLPRMAAAASVPAAFYIHPGLGLLLMALSEAAGALDGLMTGIPVRGSDFGTFLGGTLDRLSDFFYLSGFLVWAWRHQSPPWVLAGICLALLLTFMVSYVKTRAESLRCPCPVGLMARRTRTVYLMVWALLLTIFPKAVVPVVYKSALTLYCLLCLETFLRRVAFVRCEM